MSTWSSQVHPLDAIRLIGALVDREVAFVLVGGLAAIAHGATGITQDADAVPAYDDVNLERLLLALRDLDARLFAHPDRTDLAADGAPPEANALPLTVGSLKERTAWHFTTSAGLLDVLFAIDGPGGFDSLAPRAVPRTVGGRALLVAGLDDLIESKAMVGRDKDLRALDELRRIRRRD